MLTHESQPDSASETAHYMQYITLSACGFAILWIAFEKVFTM